MGGKTGCRKPKRFQAGARWGLSAAGGIPVVHPSGIGFQIADRLRQNPGRCAFWSFRLWHADLLLLAFQQADHFGYITRPT